MVSLDNFTKRIKKCLCFWQITLPKTLKQNFVQFWYNIMWIYFEYFYPQYFVEVIKFSITSLARCLKSFQKLRFVHYICDIFDSDISFCLSDFHCWSSCRSERIPVIKTIFALATRKLECPWTSWIYIVTFMIKQNFYSNLLEPLTKCCHRKISKRSAPLTDEMVRQILT